MNLILVKVMNRFFIVLLSSVSAVTIASTSVVAEFSVPDDSVERSVSSPVYQKAINLNGSDIDTIGSFAQGVYNTKRPTFLKNLKAQGYEVDTFSGKSGFNAADESGIIAFLDKKVVVAFHGTESTNDWISNLRAGMVPGQQIGYSGNVHAGFLSDYLSVQAEIKRKILEYAEANNMSASDLEITFTGHSKGGAAATVAAADFIQDEDLGLGGRKSVQNEVDDGFLTIETTDASNRGNKVKLVTFASPRVFDLDFAQQMNDDLGKGNHIRFGVYSDVVPAVPFGWAQGYKHTGTYIPMSPLQHLRHNELVAKITRVIGNLRKGSVDLQEISEIAVPTIAFLTAVYNGNINYASGVILKLIKDLHDSGTYTALAGEAFEAHKKAGTQHKGFRSRLRSAKNNVQNMASSLDEKFNLKAKAKAAKAAVKSAASKTWNTVKSVTSRAWSKAKGWFN